MSYPVTLANMDKNVKRRKSRLRITSPTAPTRLTQYVQLALSALICQDVCPSSALISTPHTLRLFHVLQWRYTLCEGHERWARSYTNARKEGDMLLMAQRTIRLLWWLMLLLCFMPLAGRGRDAQGNYVALGFGLEACQTFLQTRSNGLDMAYRHWLTGYLTAVNKLTHNTVDMRGTTDTDGILWLLEQYWSHPLHSLVEPWNSW